LRRIAAGETAFKPGVALFGCSVREAVRHDAALALLLETIVANGLRGV
jgi:hypothetical protein